MNQNDIAMSDSDDRNGQTCTMCCAGYYTETSFHDDWDGVLHCTNKKCNHEVKRYRYTDKPKPVVEKAKLTPAAQEVLTAAICDGPELEYRIAAALRAAADQVAPDDYASFTGHIEWDQGMEARSDSIREAILAIAAELEGSL